MIAAHADGVRIALLSLVQHEKFPTFLSDKMSITLLFQYVWHAHFVHPGDKDSVLSDDKQEKTEKCFCWSNHVKFLVDTKKPRKRMRHFLGFVRLIGLEPTRRKTPDPKSGASTNFATGALSYSFGCSSEPFLRCKDNVFY